MNEMKLKRKLTLGFIIPVSWKMVRSKSHAGRCGHPAASICQVHSFLKQRSEAHAVNNHGSGIQAKQKKKGKIKWGLSILGQAPLLGWDAAKIFGFEEQLLRNNIIANVIQKYRFQIMNREFEKFILSASFWINKLLWYWLLILYTLKNQVQDKPN